MYVRHPLLFLIYLEKPNCMYQMHRANSESKINNDSGNNRKITCVTAETILIYRNWPIHVPIKSKQKFIQETYIFHFDFTYARASSCSQRMSRDTRTINTLYTSLCASLICLSDAFHKFCHACLVISALLEVPIINTVLRS